MNPCIYLITVRPAEGLPIYYVGQTVLFGRRKACHLTVLRRGVHCNGKLQDAFTRFGEDRVTFEILLHCDPADTNDQEQWFLDFMCGAERCANIASDARSTARGATFSLERRQRISMKKRGLVLSEAVRQKMSLAHQGKKLSDEHRAAISASKSGDKHPMFGKRKCPRQVSAIREAQVAAGVFDRLKKPVVAVDDSGREVCSFLSLKDAALSGYSAAMISECCKGRRATHRGLKWSFAKTT